MEQPLLPGFERVVGLRGHSANEGGPLRAGFISTYVPRHCGIATFTRDLLEGMHEAAKAGDGLAGRDVSATIAALDVDGGDLDYAPEVRVVVDADDPAAYRAAATVLDDHASVVSLQHEFGIFGGDDGRHVLALIDALRAPIVTTFHTVLPRPTAGQRMVVEHLAARSSALVVLSERSRQTMVETYGVPLASVAVVPHGVPDLPYIDPARTKDRFGLAGRAVILGFGLLGPNKRFELVIEALSQIVAQLPEAIFVVVGATHPELRRRHGEAYRTSLQGLVGRLGLEEHVRFVDEYVDQADLMDWLQASDVFVTPYGSAQQAVSGTLAYALAAGKAIVSTPYDYAQELLADGRGLLTPFNDVDALADALARLLGDRATRDRMRRRAWEHARGMVWRQVGAQHLAILGAAAEQGALDSIRAWMTLPARPRRVRTSAVMAAEAMPPVRRHLQRLSDDLGIAQHAVGAAPDLRHGYCTDDVARALVADALHAEHEAGPAVARSIRRHLTFLDEAFDARLGRFRNFRSEAGDWLEAVGSEDSHGRAVAALGETAQRVEDRSVERLSRDLFAAALPACLDLRHLRPMAYASLGCVAMLDTPHGASIHAPCRYALLELGERLAGAFEATRGAPDWLWPEDVVTYDNGVLPRALLEAGRRLDRRPWVELGATVLGWLERAQRAPAGHFRPIGNRGWWPRDRQAAQWDQQPIEALSMLEAALAAEAATGDPEFGRLAERAFGWFTGANDLGLPVADPAEGACHDGLGPSGLNPNQGAESTLAWLVAVERMRGRSATEATTLSKVAAAPVLGTPAGSRAAH